MNRIKSNPKESHQNIEFSLARKAVAGNKKIAAEIFLLFAAAFFLIQSIFVLTDSVRNTLLQQRMDQYGEWEYSLPGNFQTPLGKVCDQSGLITVIGIMRPAQGKGMSVPIGFYDQEALNLARLTLVEGRLPEKPGEIAVEMETLVRMGAPYGTGTKLELNIAVLQKVKGQPAAHVAPETTFSFTVCGVIKSYSSGWATAQDQNIPQAIVTSGTGESVMDAFRSEGWQTDDFVYENYALLTLKRGYDSRSFTEFLENAGIPSDGMVSNTKTYPENPYSVLDGVLRLLYLACSLIAWCLLLLTVNKTIALERDSMRQLSFLGAGPGQMRRIVLWQCLLYTAFALPCGLLLGIVAGSGLIAAGTAITGTRISLRITGEGVFLSVLTGLFVTGAGSVLPVLFSGRLDSESKKKVKNSFIRRRRRHKKKYRRDRLPYGCLAAKTFAGAMGRSVLLIISAGLWLAVIIQIIMQIQTSVVSYQFALDTGADYKIMANLAEEDVEELRKTPGVEEVTAVKESMGFYLRPGVSGQDPYFNAVKQKEETFLPRPGIEPDEITTQIVGLGESERNDAMLTGEFGLTEPELGAFYRGEFICIFLPDLYVAENPGETMAQVYEGYFADPLPLLRSSSLAEGDTARLSWVVPKWNDKGEIEEILRESREYKIGAIADIYSYSASQRENVSANPYGIVMSQTLLEDFSSYPDGSRYQKIWVKTNDEATYESTDKAISALAAREDSTDLVNLRMIRNERFEKMLTDVSGLLFVMILLTLLMILIGYRLFTLEAEHMKSRLSLLACLGIRTGALWNLYIGRGILTGVFCGAAALLGYLAMLFIQAGKEAKTGVYSLIVMIFRRIQMTDWRAAGIVAILFVVILILLSCSPVRKILKRGIAENIY